MTKALKHAGKKSKIVAKIWRVFAVLLENVCRSDYRLLMNEFMIQNKTDMEDLEAAYN
jgi:hypothetical protein